MIRLLALVWAATLAAETSVLLPLPDLLRRLDPAQEWLLVPEAQWQQLNAPGPERADGAWLADAAVFGTVAEGQVALTATFTAINRADVPRWARLFARSPLGLGIVTVGDAPGLMHPELPAVLLPPGVHSGSLRWSCTTESVVLPAAAGTTFRLTGDGRGAAHACELTREGDQWRLTAPAPPVLDLGWTAGETGSVADAWGVVHTLDVQIQAGARPVRWAVRLSGQAPHRLAVELPPGMSLVRALSGVTQMDASGLTLEGDTGVVEGILAAEAAVALPRITTAVWQAGTVRLASDQVLDTTLPVGWRPLGADAGTRTYAVVGTAGMPVTPLPRTAGVQLRSDTTCAVGPLRATLQSVFQVRAGATRCFQVPLRLPAGWRVTSLSASGATIPDVEALGQAPTIAIPAGLAPGDELTWVLTAEADTATLPAPQPPLVVGAQRQEHRLVLAAAPSLELSLTAPAWRLEPGSADPVWAVLRTWGEPAAVQWQASTRRSAIDVDAVAWLLPQVDAAWCRIDLRLAVRAGEVSRLDVDLPLVRDADLRLTGEGLELRGDGPFQVVASKPWRGERLLRIEGHLRQPGQLPDVSLPGVSLPGQVGTVRRWVVVQAPTDLDVQSAVSTAARAVDADELPTWSQPIPGASILAAWRVTTGAAGTYQATSRALAPLPSGFIDGLTLATQVARDGNRTRLACRVAASGVGELPLDLPAGAVLEQAAIDGAPAAIRRVDGGLRLALPGRTLVHLVLRYAEPPGGLLTLPRLGGLHVTATAWQVAVEPGLVARAQEAPHLMPFTPSGWHRGFLAGWQRGDLIDETIGGLPPERRDERPDDPRALLPPPVHQAPRSDPQITLRGLAWSGARSGAPVAASFQLIPIAELTRHDALGHALAVLLGLLGALFLPRLLGVAALAAWPLAGALLAWQAPCGPLLAVCEWLPFAVCLGWVAGRLVRRSSCG